MFNLDSQPRDLLITPLNHMARRLRGDMKDHVDHQLRMGLMGLKSGLKDELWWSIGNQVGRELEDKTNV